MSAQAAIQQAVYTKLREDSTLGGLLAAHSLDGSPQTAAIYDHVPQAAAPESDEVFPYVVIGEGTATNADTDDQGGQESIVILHVWDRRRGRTRTKQILDQLYNVLHEAVLAVSGQQAVFCFWEASEVIPEEAPDTQHAISRFRIFTQET